MAAKKNYENRLGFITGVGIVGMSSVIVALLLSAHRAAGHANLIDAVGFAWIAASLTILACLVVVHPLLVHEWERPDEKGT